MTFYGGRKRKKSFSHFSVTGTNYYRITEAQQQRDAGLKTHKDFFSWVQGQWQMYNNDSNTGAELTKRYKLHNVRYERVAVLFFFGFGT